MKKLPIGVQTFAEIRSDNYCYVDKTPLIYRLADQGKSYFLSRPRRFGKSLLLDTIAEAFAGSRELFTGLYLENHWDWDRRYPVVRIDFAGGVMRNRAELDETIIAMLRQQGLRFGIELEQRLAHLVLSELIERLHETSGERVVVLVDEYDKPILDNLESPELATELRDGLRNLYSVLKAHDAQLRFVFLTGVSKFSKVSLFSGLNNLEDLTLDKRYATICGYTQQDVEQVFAEYLEGVDLEELRRWYNGYNWLGEPVYNPFDVLLFFAKEKEYRNYWFETGNPSFLVRLVEERRYPVPNLERVMASDELLSSFDVGSLELETLLFQTGYLTIKERHRLGNEYFYTLTYPNREVKRALTGTILSALAKSAGERARYQMALYQALAAGDCDVMRDIFHAFFASIPHDRSFAPLTTWYRKNQLAGYEGYYASIFYCYFTALGLDVVVEDSTSVGRIDMTVFVEGKIYILEFKVVSKGAKTGSALAQIREKRYADKYRGQGEIYLLGVEFDKESRNIVGFEWATAQGLS
ncbi:ATPase AAA [Desulfolithobacter dissulfuricans]|uniref:ATPase AAA n=1 Tax=Desulfolithobacter dissulfuricans TaxID=2795293 RepID=A0A915XKU4_9BACT|nr:ATP-binding protein [Desulfolithobacter dissulfuricans]BCO09718.1 ATPase AAA [Desulfolithobacter dissulfuricans]